MIADEAGIAPITYGPDSPILVINSGSVYGGLSGILVSSATGSAIVNTGTIAAGTDLAIGAFGASTEIFNTGRITGFVDLTDSPDRFINQAGGVFEISS